jgi:NADH-quinone oxidoreductase subunit E
MEAIEDREQIIKGAQDILNSRNRGFSNLISILQDIQRRFRYIPREAMIEVARHLQMSPANVYGVATFYNQFRFNPPGRYHIRVCMGTACHVKKGDQVLDQWKRRLEIEEGERTPDGEYSLETVACVGCCVLAPVTIINDEVIGHMAPTKVDGILLQHKIQREQAEKEKGNPKNASEPREPGEDDKKDKPEDSRGVI